MLFLTHRFFCLARRTKNNLTCSPHRSSTLPLPDSPPPPPPKSQHREGGGKASSIRRWRCSCRPARPRRPEPAPDPSQPTTAKSRAQPLAMRLRRATMMTQTPWPRPCRHPRQAPSPLAASPWQPVCRQRSCARSSSTASRLRRPRQALLTLKTRPTLRPQDWYILVEDNPARLTLSPSPASCLTAPRTPRLIRPLPRFPPAEATGAHDAVP